MYQLLIRHLRKDAGPAGNPEVLLVAPTGKAAHNIVVIIAPHAFNLKFDNKNKSEKFLVVFLCDVCSQNYIAV